MYDILTLGSSTIDIFIKTLNNPEVIKHNHHFDLAYHLGDKLLVDDVVFSTGGGGTNTAVAFSRLGLKTGIISVLGKDAHGRHILAELKKEKVTFLGKMKDGKTGLSIILPSAKDRTILSYKGVNNYLSIKDVNAERINTRWLYVSSLLGKSHETAETIIRVAKKKGTKVALNLSLYIAKNGLNSLSFLLNSADVVVVNKEEAQAMTKKKHIKEMFDSIYEHTNAIVAITSGSGEIYGSDGHRIYQKKIHPINPVDKTGAGDAFAAGFVYAIIKDKDIPTALEYGHKEALSVLMEIGAKNNLLRKL